MGGGGGCPLPPSSGGYFGLIRIGAEGGGLSPKQGPSTDGPLAKGLTGPGGAGHFGCCGMLDACGRHESRTLKTVAGILSTPPFCLLNGWWAGGRLGLRPPERIQKLFQTMPPLPQGKRGEGVPSDRDSLPPVMRMGPTTPLPLPPLRPLDPRPNPLALPLGGDEGGPGAGVEGAILHPLLQRRRHQLQRRKRPQHIRCDAHRWETRPPPGPPFLPPLQNSSKKMNGGEHLHPASPSLSPPPPPLSLSPSPTRQIT